MKKIIAEIYETSDGELFLNKKDAEAHQKNLDKESFSQSYLVRFWQEMEVTLDLNPTDPDLTLIAQGILEQYSLENMRHIAWLGKPVVREVVKR